MFTAIGKVMMNWLDQTGGAADMVRSAGFWLARSRFEFKQFVLQSITIGVDSFGVTALTSLFTGMVLALQAGNTINNIFGDPIFVGTIVSFSLIREPRPRADGRGGGGPRGCGRDGAYRHHGRNGTAGTPCIRWAPIRRNTWLSRAWGLFC